MAQAFPDGTGVGMSVGWRGMKKLFLALVAFALPHLSWGQLLVFNANLSGDFEVPLRITPAKGFAIATLDTTSLAFTLDYSFSNLLSAQSDAHIHRAPSGVSGPVIIPLLLGNSIHFESILTAAQAADLVNELWYVNIHSTTFRAGEIRGQLVAVPEPSTYALAGVAMLGLVVLKRRRSLR